MNSIRKYISQVVGEEEEDRMEMETDNFTEYYLSQFPSIDNNTIDVLINNGYQNKEALLAFDLKEDLPLLPDVNMAQKSLLRKVLKEFQSMEELESKVNDIKGVDEEVVPNNSRLRKALQKFQPTEQFEAKVNDIIGIDEEFLPNSSRSKRKRGSVIESPPSMSKRSKPTELISDLDSSYRTHLSDSFTRRTGPSVSETKSFGSPIQHNFEPEVNSNMFEFVNSRTSTGSRLSGRPNVSTNIFGHNTQSEESSEEEVVKKVLKGRPRAQRNSGPKPLFGSQTTARNSLLNKSLEKINTIEPKVEAKSIPTPTELEVREHLAKKQAMGKTARRGRKRV